MPNANQSAGKQIMNSVTAESCDANLDYDAFNASCEINSVTTFNRRQSMAINRHYFEVNLRFKNLKEVPMNKIQGNQSIKCLDLSHNTIASLPSDIWSCLPNLAKLNLDYNLLEEIKNEGPAPPKLQICSIANNKLKEFPISILASKLLVLQINDNEIADVPASVGSFMQLKCLNLHQNPIPKLPVSLNMVWDNIQEFSIDWLTYLQPFVGKMIRLGSNIETEETQMETVPDKKIK